ncbi:MAG: hypothetical protein H0X12_08365 [Nocardioides sp.]|nr:hypothetical protein [Nocardioides sp.]
MSGHVPITVTGGAGGVAASYDDLLTLGLLYRTVGAELAGAAWHDKLEAADGDLVLSSVLAPQTFAAAESAILAATYGPHGLVSRAALVEAHSLAFAAVVELYRAADALQHAAYEAMSYGLGVTIGAELVPIAVTGGLAYLVARRVSPTLVTDLDVVAWAEANSEVVQAVVNGGGGLLDGLALNPVSGPLMRALGLDGLHLTTGSAADDLGELLFGDYAGTAVPTTVDEPYDVPTSVEDLIRDLAATAGEGDGEITIQRLTGPDGETRWIVHLPGTDHFVDQHAIRNLGSNLNLIAGDDTAYGQAISLAMKQAGVQSDDPVLMVGHSQGGMQAAALSADPDFRYHVTHVVTAGAPVGTFGIPDNVSVLSLENSADLVPSLDGEDNRDSARHTTVRADVRTGNFDAGAGNHGLDLYADLAGTVDGSADPSVRAAIADLEQSGFIGSTDAESQTFGYRTEVGDLVRPADIADRSAIVKTAA